MLKISQVEPVNHTVMLRFEGSLAGPWVAEAQKACESALKVGRSLKLQLADVEFMDASGVALLSGLRSRGVILADCSPFVAEQLKTTAGN